MGIGFAQCNHAGLGEACDDGGILFRDPVFEYAGTTRGAHAARGVKILVPQWDAVQMPTIVAGGNFLFGLLGCGACAFGIDRDKSIERAVQFIDSVKACIGDIDG